MPLNATDRLNLLLGKGFFPEPLPPCFTTKSLSAVVAAGALGGTKTANTGKNAGFACEPFAVPKLSHSRRTFSIPNPLPHSSCHTHRGKMARH